MPEFNVLTRFISVRTFVLQYYLMDLHFLLTINSKMIQVSKNFQSVFTFKLKTWYYHKCQKQHKGKSYRVLSHICYLFVKV